MCIRDSDSGAPQGYAKDSRQVYFHNGDGKVKIIKGAEVSSLDVYKRQSLTTEHILGLVSQLRPDLVKQLKTAGSGNLPKDIQRRKTCLLYTSRCV